MRCQIRKELDAAKPQMHRLNPACGITERSRYVVRMLVLAKKRLLTSDWRSWLRYETLSWQPTQLHHTSPVKLTFCRAVYNTQLCKSFAVSQSVMIRLTEVIVLKECYVVLMTYFFLCSWDQWLLILSLQSCVAWSPAECTTIHTIAWRYRSVLSSWRPPSWSDTPFMSTSLSDLLTKW